MTIRLDPLILFVYLIEYSAAICSLVINAYLIRLVWIRGFRFGNYRYFIYVFALLDCIYSTGGFISMTVPFNDDKIWIFFSIAPWRENRMVFRISQNVYFLSYICILVHVTMSSVYRYALLCNETLLKMFENKSRLAIMICLFLIFYSFWLKTVNDILNENVPLSKNDIEIVLKEYSVDLQRVTVTGNTLVNFTTQPLVNKVVFIVFVGVLFLLVSGFCGYSIHTTLQSKAISNKAKRAHSKALNLLIAQFALPFFFLYIPTVIVESFALLLQANIPMFIKIFILVFFSYYPVANAALIIFLTDDFRLYILSTSGGECTVVNVMALPPPFLYPLHTTHSL